MWAYTVLEIYQPTDFHADGEVHTAPWPTGGTPADWIEQELVGYCQGNIEDLVAGVPLWKLLWWKIRKHLCHRR